eukprot:m51a1_g3935 nucleotide diphosphatase, putative (457) ;mRNA; f:240717-242381
MQRQAPDDTAEQRLLRVVPATDALGVETEEAKPSFWSRRKRLLVPVLATCCVLVLVVMGAVGVAFAVTPKPPKPSPEPQPTAPPPVVLVSVDGFRWDWVLGRANVTMPHLRALAEEGAMARELEGVFPSKTFPSHWTLATGLWPESHGVLDSRMYDPGLGEWFSAGRSARDPRWWLGEPVWATMARHGLRSGVYFWPGSESPVTPTYWVPYDKSAPYDKRVDTALGWLALPQDQRPSLVAVYFEGVDSMGHAYGPDSAQVDRAIEEFDAALGRLVRGLPGDATLVVLSDHGMSAITPSRTLSLVDDCGLAGPVSWDTDVARLGALASLWINESAAPSITNCSSRLAVYTREQLPERYHNKRSSRSPHITVVPQCGWSVVLTRNDASNVRGGDHGWDPLCPEMRGILLAKGPRVKRGAVAGTLRSVDVYQFLVELLGIPPAPNNGTAKAIASQFLRN